MIGSVEIIEVSEKILREKQIVLGDRPRRFLFYATEEAAVRFGR